MKGQVGDYSLRKVSAGVAAVVKQAIAMCGIFSNKTWGRKKRRKRKRKQKKSIERAAKGLLLVCCWHVAGSDAITLHGSSRGCHLPRQMPNHIRRNMRKIRTT